MPEAVKSTGPWPRSSQYTSTPMSVSPYAPNEHEMLNSFGPTVEYSARGGRKLLIASSQEPPATSSRLAQEYIKVIYCLPTNHGPAAASCKSETRMTTAMGMTRMSCRGCPGGFDTDKRHTKQDFGKHSHHFGQKDFRNRAFLKDSSRRKASTAIMLRGQILADAVTQIRQHPHPRQLARGCLGAACLASGWN